MPPPRLPKPHSEPGLKTGPRPRGVPYKHGAKQFIALSHTGFSPRESPFSIHHSLAITHQHQQTKVFSSTGSATPLEMFVKC